MNKVSTLKLREYCAEGLPFVYAYDDSEFDNYRFAKKFSNDDDPIDINEIVSFYNEIKTENYYEIMRDFARKNLTWDVQMKPVIDVIEEHYKDLP